MCKVRCRRVNKGDVSQSSTHLAGSSLRPRGPQHRHRMVFGDGDRLPQATRNPEKRLNHPEQSELSGNRGEKSEISESSLVNAPGGPGEALSPLPGHWPLGAGSRLRESSRHGDALYAMRGDPALCGSAIHFKFQLHHRRGDHLAPFPRRRACGALCPYSADPFSRTRQQPLRPPHSRYVDQKSAQNPRPIHFSQGDLGEFVGGGGGDCYDISAGERGGGKCRQLLVCRRRGACWDRFLYRR